MASYATSSRTQSTSCATLIQTVLIEKNFCIEKLSYLAGGAISLFAVLGLTRGCFAGASGAAMGGCATAEVTTIGPIERLRRAHGSGAGEAARRGGARGSRDGRAPVEQTARARRPASRRRPPQRQSPPPQPSAAANSASSRSRAQPHGPGENSRRMEAAATRNTQVCLHPILKPLGRGEAGEQPQSLLGCQPEQLFPVP